MKKKRNKRNNQKGLLRIIPLGGLGEIGRNMMVYEYNEQLLIVDLGILFPANDMLGIDYIIPDIQYLIEHKDQIAGIVITHGHEDHIGAVHHVLEEIQAPIYATQLTCGLLEVKLARSNLLSKTTLNIVKAGTSVDIGPFRVEFVHMSHSIPDCVGLGIQTPAGLVVHSGDFKFDQTPVDNWPSDFSKLGEFSRRGVLALLADSTNAAVPGWTPSERVVDKALEQVFSQAPGRIIIASFASLISRIQQVANASIRHGRKLAVVGTSMVDNVKITRKMGYLDIPDSAIVPIDQALAMKPAEVVLMCTGSQGEPTSILGKLSTGTNRQFDIQAGDTVVLSSQAIPGNEENVYRTINRLFSQGANVIYESVAPVHVSGHASQEELKLLLNLVNPKHYIPVHGELRHLKQNAMLAEQVGISPENIAVVENGQVIEFMNGKMRLGEKIPYSYIFVDGSGVGDVGPEVMREREALGRDGVVVVNVVIDRDGNIIENGLSITSHGFMADQEVESVLASAAKRISEKVSQSNGNLQKIIENDVRTFLYSETRRRPRVFVSVNQVGCSF